MVWQLLKGWGIGLVGNLVLGAIGGVIGGYAFDVANIIDVGDYADPVIAATTRGCAWPVLVTPMPQV